MIPEHWRHLPGPLRFVSDGDDYSVYEDRDGDEWNIGHGTGNVLVDFDELDLSTLWSTYLYEGADRWSYADQQAFLTMLAGRTTDPDTVDEIEFCTDCRDPHLGDDLTSTKYTTVCEACLDEYWMCNSCDERVQETTTTAYETEVCEGCRDNHYTYCDNCDAYYSDDDDEHCNDNNEECDCESPAQSFTIRNDGDTPLANDTRVTVSLPAGVIDAEGIKKITRYLRDREYFDMGIDPDTASKLRQIAYRIEEIGVKWQAKDGNYTKRLSRFAYKEFHLKLTPEWISEVGNIASAHSSAVDFEIDVTRDLNQGPEEFAHESSCWWTDHAFSRCTFKSNGGFGLRTHRKTTHIDGYDYSMVTGRAWVMPLRKDHNGNLKPTFDTESPDAFVVFNGYENLEGYAPARIMAHMAGMTYRKITFSAHDAMYVNNSAGYLVAPEEIATDYTDGSLSLYFDTHANLYDTERELSNV